jgi:kynureninase
MSAPAGLYNIVADQGSTLSRTIVWKDPAKKPILLDGYTARMKVRAASTSSTVVLELTTENGRITLGQSNGQISLLVTDEVMATVAEGKYQYDLELVAPSSNLYVYKILKGNFVVRPEVTR